jgi:hypothetical protein
MRSKSVNSSRTFEQSDGRMTTPSQARWAPRPGSSGGAAEREGVETGRARPTCRRAYGQGTVQTTCTARKRHRRKPEWYENLPPVRASEFEPRSSQKRRTESRLTEIAHRCSGLRIESRSVVRSSGLPPRHPVAAAARPPTSSELRPAIAGFRELRLTNAASAWYT